MDPQQRMLLEDAYASLHSSGWRRGDMAARCGTFLGIQALDHLHATLAAPAAAIARRRTRRPPARPTLRRAACAIACGRLACTLRLQGPRWRWTPRAPRRSSPALRAARMQLQECASSVIACVNVMLVPAVHALFANAG